MYCKDKIASWHLIGFVSPLDEKVTLGQQYHVGEKPTVILLPLYTYIYLSTCLRDTKQNKDKRQKVNRSDYNSIYYIWSRIG